MQLYGAPLDRIQIIQIAFKGYTPTRFPHGMLRPFQGPTRVVNDVTPGHQALGGCQSNALGTTGDANMQRRSLLVFDLIETHL